MTKIYVNPKHLNRDEFLTPFDKVFDELMNKSFPTFKENSVVDMNPQWFNVSSVQKKNMISREILKNNTLKIDNFFLKLSAQYDNVFYFDIFNYLCPNTQKECFQNQNYKDEWHLSEKGALFIYPEFVNFLKLNNLLK